MALRTSHKLNIENCNTESPVKPEVVVKDPVVAVDVGSKREGAIKSELELEVDENGHCDDAPLLGLEKLSISESELLPPFSTENDESKEHLRSCPKTWKDIYAFFESEKEDIPIIPISFEFSSKENGFELSTRNVFYLKTLLDMFLHDDSDMEDSFLTDDDDDDDLCVLRPEKIVYEDPLSEARPNLKELSKFMEENPDYTKTLSSSHFEFHGGSLAKNADLNDFLTNYACQLKSIALCYNCSNDNENLKVSMLEYASFIQHFSQAEMMELNFPKSWYVSTAELSDEEFRQINNMPLNLPKLKTVILGSSIKMTKMSETVLLKIAESAENLEEIQNTFPALQEILARHGLIRLVKCVDISPSEDENNSRYKASYLKFADAEPKLTTVNIGCDVLRFLPKENEKAIGKILLSSKDTLEEMWMHPLASLKKLKFPVLSKLKKLHLCNLPNDKDRDVVCAYTTHHETHHGLGMEALHLVRVQVRGWVERDYVMFPHGVNVSTAFPNLVSVSLDLNTDDTQYARLYFPSRPCIPSVKELIINGSCTCTWIKKLALMFPNLTQLELGFNASDVAAARDLWQSWPLLESLYFQYVDWVNGGFPALDTIFTGIPEKFCEKLRKFKEPPASGRTAGIEKMRKKSSLLLLKNLKQLKMRLVNQEENFDDSTDCCSSPCRLPALEAKKQEYKLISPVSLYHAFMKMPELKVTIEYCKIMSSDLEHDLKSLWPHVKFDDSI